MYQASYLLICGYCYFVLVGLFYVAVFAVGCVFCIISPPRTLVAYLWRVARLGLFIAILLVVGDIFGFIWGGTIYGRFYESTDYCGTDFLPFIPITQGVLDASFGDQWHGLIGVSLFQLNLIWLLFATGTWVMTIVFYRVFCRKLLSRAFR